MKKITLFLAEHLMKPSASEDLLRTVREAFAGIAFPDSPVPAGSSQQPSSRRSRSAATAGPALTRRQTIVLRLVAEGHSNTEIARMLSLSIKTVEKHRQLLMDKLGIHKVATLTRYAVAGGIVESKTCAELVGIPRSRGKARFLKARRSAGANNDLQLATQSDEQFRG
jgi:DNA-binding NarL/FixJ family response regulator